MTSTLSIADHFRRLLDFSGREDRASFWPYAGVAFGIVMSIGILTFVPMVLQAMAAMQEFAAQHPEQVTIKSGPGRYSMSVSGEHPSFIPEGGLLLYLGTTFGSAILLYAAAVARRLRDAGVTPWLGTLPLPFIAYSSIQMPRLFASAGQADGPDTAVFLSVFFSNFVYMAALGILVFLLVKKSNHEAD